MSHISEERKESLLKRYGGSDNLQGQKKNIGFGGPRNRGNIGFRKPKNASNTIKRLLDYIGKDKIKLLFVFACV